MKPTNSKINVNLKNLETVKCPSCGKEFFTTVWHLKKIPALVSKSGRDEIFPVAGFRCVNCGVVFCLTENIQ